MKLILKSKNQHEQGVALLISIVIMLIVASILATYLLLSQNEFRTVQRSQVWNGSMALTEAGIEEAEAFMNKYDGNLNMVSQWSTAASAAQDGWTVNGTTYTMTRVVDTNIGYYTVTIDNSVSNAPVITSQGYTYNTLASAQTPFMMAGVGLSINSSYATIKRAVVVSNTFEALFPDAIDSVTNITFNGSGVTIDSFDSSNPQYSDWNANLGFGTYDQNKNRANGNVATDSTILNAMSVGNANIYGKVNTGPGGTVSTGPNGYVGGLPQTGSGIQSGYSNDTMNITFPDVSLPSGAAGWTPIADGATITNSGNYTIGAISSGLTIGGSNVVIYVSGSISMSGQSAINITTNAHLVVFYVAGPSVSLTGQATINNLTQHAIDFQIYGLPTLTTINLGGNAAITGVIYAPEADYSFGGGGNNSYDAVGAMVVHSVSMGGHPHFHYDEALRTEGPGRGYLPTSWREIGAN